MSDPTKASDQNTAAPVVVDTEPTWNVFGLRVARKTEIIALVAFILSASGVLWQVFIYTRGAVVRLFPTDQILFTATDTLGRSYAGEENLLALVLTMSYVNDGETGQNAIVRREYVLMSLGTLKVEHRWYEFGSTDVEIRALKFKRDSEARPFPVVAASATSHETLFAPWEIECLPADSACNPVKNFVKWSDFIEAIKANSNIVITAQADVYPTKRIAAICTVRLRDWEIDILEREKGLSAACLEENGSDRPRRKAQSTMNPAAKK